MTDSCEIMFSVDEWLKTVEMKKFVVHGMFLQMKITLIICHKNNTSTTGTKLVAPSQQVGRWHPTIEKTFWLQTSVVYIRTFTPRSWRTTTQANAILEVPATAIVIEFFTHLVAMERILVVFLRIQRKSRNKRQAKACDRSGQPVVYSILAKISDEWLSRIPSILVQKYRLQLTAVYCNRRGV